MTIDINNQANLQAVNSAHHLHSFIDPRVIEEAGAKVIVRGDGCFVWDAGGNRKLDGMAGLWCVNVGYGREELVKAASEQMRALPFYSNHFQSTTPPLIALAERLSQITPRGFEHFAFANSGSEANDTIVRLVRHFWRAQGKPGKSIFIGRTLGYHGTTVAAASLGGMTHMHSMDGTPLPGFAHIAHPHHYLHGGAQSPEEFGLAAARLLDAKIEKLGADNVAAFIGEPIQGAGGVIVPPATYWPEIQRICRKHNILLVADEVICGFGRTGQWFGSQTLGIEPDLMPMAKGLSSGYQPVSAVAIHDRVYAGIRDGGLVAHGFTYSGHPVACAVALANIDIIAREGLVERTRDDIGPYFHRALDQIADEHPLVGEKRGVGLIAALQLVRDKNSRELFPAAEDPAIACRETAYRNGLIVRAINQAVILCPPLTVSRSEVDEIVDLLKQSLDETARSLRLM